MGSEIPSETELLSQFLNQNYRKEDVRRNVRLGKIRSLEHGKYLTLLQRKADAVVVYDDMIDIIEAKPKPDPEAMGQLLFYKWLLRQTPEYENMINKPIFLILLTCLHDSDLEECCAHYGISYRVFSTF